jgi:hypothetical protein
MSEHRFTHYEQSAHRLLNHLDLKLKAGKGYPDAPTWGYAFTYLAALMGTNGSSSPLSEKALQCLLGQDRKDRFYPWEFVLYAMAQVPHLTTHPLPDEFDRYRAVGTRMFNWYLLRNVNKKLYDKFSKSDCFKLRLALSLYQKGSGIILDEFRTRSLQYHAFCLFALCELVDFLPGEDWLKSRLLRGVQFSSNYVLDDGTSLYIGRGQEQIFGYGALLYAMEYCHKRVAPLDLGKIERVAQKLMGSQRGDGSFPLVLRGREAESPELNFSRDRPAGWYGYNTLYDYQPFLAYCLLKIRSQLC